MAPRVKPLDFIGAIELAYDRSTEEDLWLANVTKAIAPAFSPGPPTTSFFFNLIEEDAAVGTTASVAQREDEEAHTRADYQRLHQEGKAIDRPPRPAYECDMFTVLSRVIGAKDASTMLRAAGMAADDALGLRANMTGESGVIFTTHVEPGFRIRNRNLWTRLAAHIGSALRLRRLHDGATLTPESSVAVLSSTGRLEHAEDAAAVEAKADLAEAAKAIDRARGKMRRVDPENASALWRAMVRGEWSLVDWFDHDGKRFLLAQSNTIPPASPLARAKSLTEREHQVVACAAMGHSNKLIAYDLGLSTGTVSVRLASQVVLR